MIKNLKKGNTSISIHKCNNSKQSEENISRIVEDLLYLIGKYKTKRTLWELKLKTNYDPREHEFYAIIARLSMLDIMIMDLEHLNWLLVKKTNFTELDDEASSPALQM